MTLSLRLIALPLAAAIAGLPAAQVRQVSPPATTAVYSADSRQLVVSIEGKPRFKYTFNRGGAINGIYDLRFAPNQNVIGESYQGETTDRVIQWTYWNSRYEGDPHDLGDGDVRADTTMEGCFHEAATCKVLKTPASGPTKEIVFESRIEHWFYKALDRHGRPRFDTTSRYRVLDDGSLKLTRSVRRHPWILRNITIKTWDGHAWTREKSDETRLIATHYWPRSMTSYFEGWTPLNRTILPNQSHARGSFEKDGYEFWEPGELGGWAMAHSDTLAFARQASTEEQTRTAKPVGSLQLLGLGPGFASRRDAEGRQDHENAHDDRIHRAPDGFRGPVS